MKLFLRITILLISVSVAFPAVAAKNRKAILLLERNAQRDTIGYNIVTDLTSYFYDWIVSNKITLWDSPAKNHKLSAEDLYGIENTTQTKFRDLPSLLIYENWNFNRQSYSCDIIGYSLISNNNNEEVLYGYIEQNDQLKNLLSAAYLNVNTFAPYGINLWQALMNKRYDFDIVFYQNGAVHDLRKSNYLKSKIFSGKNLKEVEITNARLIEYIIETGPSELSENSYALIKNIEDFFNKNEQEFFNYGGDEIYSYLKKTPVLVSDVRITEILVLRKDKLYSKTLLVTPYVLGLPLKPIAMKTIEDWKLEINGKRWEEILNAKNFYYRISRINNTIIPIELADTFKTKLYNKDWNNLISDPLVKH